MFGIACAVLSPLKILFAGKESEDSLFYGEISMVLEVQGRFFCVAVSFRARSLFWIFLWFWVFGEFWEFGICPSLQTRQIRNQSTPKFGLESSPGSGPSVSGALGASARETMALLVLTLP